jgi:hypothetical protein
MIIRFKNSWKTIKTFLRRKIYCMCNFLRWALSRRLKVPKREIFVTELIIINYNCT